MLHTSRKGATANRVFIHFCHAPLWVCSAKRRHHSPEWTILSHVNCFIQGEVQWFQVLLGSLHPRSTGHPGDLPPAPRVSHTLMIRFGAWNYFIENIRYSIQVILQTKIILLSAFKKKYIPYFHFYIHLCITRFTWFFIYVIIMIIITIYQSRCRAL